jgi:hypothetical protein
VLSSCWNPWRKTIPDNHLVPTFYKLNLGGCPRQHIMSVTETCVEMYTCSNTALGRKRKNRLFCFSYI